MHPDAVRAVRQAFANARPAASRIERSYGSAKPLAGPSTWEGKHADHWLTGWHHSANRLMRLLSSLDAAEQAAVNRTEAQGRSGART